MFAHARSEQKGISLLELMLALVVISALLLLTARYYQQTRENLRVAQAIEMINNVVKTSYGWLEGQPNFGGIRLDTLISSKFLPSFYSGNSNPWKGTIEVTSADIKDNNQNVIANHVTVILTNIPAKSCQNLKEKMQSRATVGIMQPTCTGSANAQTFSMSF
jgi:type II secretory pathway pseudopilin PulG